MSIRTKNNILMHLIMWPVKFSAGPWGESELDSHPDNQVNEYILENGCMNGLLDKAPITARERVELRRNAENVVQTAIWNGYVYGGAEAEIAGKFAKEYFNLGCWLYYYGGRLNLKDNLSERVDCAERLFEAGFSDPGDYFFVVFGFGKHQFSELFKDGDIVYEELEKNARSNMNRAPWFKKGR